MTENDKNKRQVTIGFRGSEEYRRFLQEEALRRKTKVQPLIEEAVSCYLSSHIPALASTAAENPAGDAKIKYSNKDKIDDILPDIRSSLQALQQTLSAALDSIEQNLGGADAVDEPGAGAGSGTSYRQKYESLKEQYIALQGEYQAMLRERAEELHSAQLADAEEAAGGGPHRKKNVRRAV